MSQVIIREIYSLVFWFENSFLKVKPSYISLLTEIAVFTVTSINVISCLQ